MMPLSPVLIDVRPESRLETRPHGAIGARPVRGRLAVLEENRRLRAENTRLAEEAKLLREAAAIWIRLYEKQLARANDATRAQGTVAESLRK